MSIAAIIARQRPPTARGTAFIALEDEGGVVNVILRPEVFAAYRAAHYLLILMRTL